MVRLSNKYQMKLDRSLGDGHRNGFLKQETEGLIRAAQEQALRTSSIKYSIDKTSETSLCRKCGNATERQYDTLSVDARSLP